MAIQPIGINHKAANLAILSYQIDLHTWRVPKWVNAVVVHSRYTKRKYLHCYVLSQKFFYCVTPMPRKWEKNFVSSAERKSCKSMPVEMPVEQSISSTSEELKSNDTTSVVASGTGTPDMSRVFFGLLNRLHMLCHCFSER